MKSKAIMTIGKIEENGYVEKSIEFKFKNIQDAFNIAMKLQANTTEPIQIDLQMRICDEF